jgi:signal transduction histidine kinase
MPIKAFLLILLFFFNYSFANNSDKKSHILIINSYHKGFQWSDELIFGIEKVINNDKNIETTILYMDSKRISSIEYYDQLKELYKLQLKNRKYDLVLLVDKFAYEFALKNYNELFKNNEKLIFTGIEQFDSLLVEKSGLTGKISGIIEKRAISDIVNIINKMMPKLKKLYIINDFSKNGDDSDISIKNAINQNSNLEVEYIRYSTIDELKNKFSTYKKDEAVFFIRFYNNKNQELHTNQEIASMINSFELPTFSTDSLFIGKGSIGGKLVIIDNLGENTGDLILEHLKNKDAKPIIKTYNNYSYIFDYEKLEKFNLSTELLKKRISFVNVPLSFLDKNRSLVNAVFIISPILLFFIILLFYNLQLQIKNTKHQEFIIQQSKLAEIGEIISSIAHQWKEPLIEISTLVQEHIISSKKTKEEEEKYLKDIMFQIYYMTDTINDFQDFIKPSTKKTHFDIKDAIIKMMHIVEHNIKYNYIDININFQEESKLIVLGYNNELMQSLLNIVNNAKDSIIKKRGTNKKFKGLINIDIFRKKEFVQIEISDNGGGVDEKDIRKIFDSYYSTKEKGHGIGLYMTKVIIEDKMQGSIYQLNKNDGATFIIKLRLENENFSS